MNIEPAMSVPVKNIIFDLGGVLLDIDFAKTRTAFQAAGVANFDDYFQQSYSNPLFSDLEKGLITPTEFYDLFRVNTGIMISDTEIESNWNALLGNYRKASLDTLSALKKQYRLFLFSNTNLIHYQAFMEAFQLQVGAGHFNDYFERAYYSHEMNHRKPEPASFLFITKENKLVPGETLFIDDTLKNIEGAKEAGLQTLWLQNGMLIEEVLKPLMNS